MQQHPNTISNLQTYDVLVKLNQYSQNQKDLTHQPAKNSQRGQTIHSSIHENRTNHMDKFIFHTIQEYIN